ncbi:MAG: DUF4350 domain-containing protein [Gammaproteobacteria bacterium]|jgi:hypothetical protein
MITTKNAIIASLVVGVAGLLVAGFFFFFEPVEEEINTGYSAEARRDQFLAAQRFMAQLDIKSENIKGFDELYSLPAGNDVLLTHYSHRFEQAKTRGKLLAWVEQGGHLLLELNPFSRNSDLDVETPFLDQLQVWPRRSNVLFDNVAGETITVTVYQNSEPLTVAFHPYYTLDVNRKEPILLFNDRNGIHLVEFKHGDGTVTILSDMDMWRNRSIGDNDHATMLAHILGVNPGKVWILRNTAMPSLIELMWQYGREAVLAAGLLLLLWLWSLYNRFGPMVIINRQQRRSLLEHLDAVGEFEWRYQRANHILTTVRQELHQIIETYYPQWQKKSSDEQIAWLSKRARIPEQDISQALTANPEHQTSFTRYIKILQTIRKTV